MKQRAEIAHERAHDAEEKNKRQEEALKNYAEITKKDKQTIDRLKLQIHELEETAKANEISEDLVQELYCMAYDKEADAQEKMEKAADQMTDAIREGEDAQKFAEEYEIQKEKRSRYRKVMEKLDEREKRRAGR